jgi:hypothetical protein
MNCLNCNQSTTNKKFCSRSCSVSYLNRVFPKRKPEHFCKGCNKNITSENVFCSKECRIQYQTNKPKPPRKINKGLESLRAKRYRDKLKLKAIEYKGGKCVICGYNKCARSLDFHHLDPNTKEFTVSSKKISFEALKEELNKCILVCKNCHGEIHAGILAVPTGLEPAHTSVTGKPSTIESTTP